MPRTKNNKSKRSRSASGDEGNSDKDGPISKSNKKSKSSTSATAGATQRNEEDELYWPLSATRRIGIQDFKGMTLLSIREYYNTAAGDLRPTKKGISLTVDQYKALVEAMPAINTELAALGHEIPDMSTKPAAATTSPLASTKEKDGKKSKGKKQNIEVTSEEDEEDHSVADRLSV